MFLLLILVGLQRGESRVALVKHVGDRSIVLILMRDWSPGKDE